MDLRRTVSRIAVGAATLTTVVVATTTSANAAILTDIQTGSGKCPANWVCLWSENNFIKGAAGNGFDFGAVGSDENQADMGKFAFDSKYWRWKGMPDATSSVVNNTRGGVCFYEHTNYGGLEFRIGAGEKWASVPSWINDRISSFKFC
ncbi:peptidase inhibitor family I36 protein [Streptomyces sp. NPDC048606]|uniref:peptidase inhibitor family I36 protein n=1 Tax=Streptomyces sp. NPDC048606 TaxID=3154726 RepID=UPI00342F0187